MKRESILSEVRNHERSLYGSAQIRLMVFLIIYDVFFHSRREFVSFKLVVFLVVVLPSKDFDSDI